METIGNGSRRNGRDIITNPETRARDRYMSKRHNQSLQEFSDRERYLKSNAGNIKDQVRRDSRSGIRNDSATNRRLNEKLEEHYKPTGLSSAKQHQIATQMQRKREDYLYPHLYDKTKNYTSKAIHKE